jgi:hypothetical protein
MFILAAGVLRMGRVRASANQSRLVWLWALLPLLAFSLARTQHHWYLDPTYPAWSILAAVAILNLMTLGALLGRITAMSFLVIGLLFCEARILFRVFRTDRRPPTQAFLLSLHDQLRLPADTAIVARFPLSHSERFILQVVDGYRVSEPDLQRSPDTEQPSEHMVLLARLQEAAAMRAEFPQASVVAAGGGYLLLRK